MKKLTYISSGLVLVLLFFVSCEEYYNPKLEVVPAILVVESHLSNNPQKNFVKLTKALDFYSTSQAEKIIGAKVDLIQFFGETTRGIESSSGYFTFPTTPVSEKKYLLRITYQKDIFESNPVIMPPLPSIDTLYTKHKIEKTYRTDAFGVPELAEISSREISVDAPITKELEYYRFIWRGIIQWVYTPPAPPFQPPPPSWFGWLSKYQGGNFNIAGPKEFSVSDKVSNHPILSLAYDTRLYLDSATQIAAGWIVIIDQYGIPKESYDFHNKLNKQFSADGSLFDPVLTQIYGNIHCKNDPSKIVLGFFDLNSHRQYRYFFNFGINENSKVIQRRLNRYPDIPDTGYELGTYPDFWEHYY